MTSNGLQLLQSCTEPSIWHYKLHMLITSQMRINNASHASDRTSQLGLLGVRMQGLLPEYVWRNVKLCAANDIVMLSTTELTGVSVWCGRLWTKSCWWKNPAANITCHWPRIYRVKWLRRSGWYVAPKFWVTTLGLCCSSKYSTSLIYWRIIHIWQYCAFKQPALWGMCVHISK